MANYSYLMDGEIEKFEETFVFKKKYIEEFILNVQERADIEDNYAKGLQKVANNFNILMERGSITNTVTSFKSYHALKAEQARILADYLRSDVLQDLRDLVKVQVVESKKVFADVKRCDINLKQILDKLDKSKSKFMKTSKDIEDTLAFKEYLESLESKDPAIEERKMKNSGRLHYLNQEKEEMEKQIKSNVEEFNSYKDTFTNQCNQLKDFFRKFDLDRLNGIKDSVMKSVVYEISFLRNLQYDIDKLVPKVNEVQFEKDLAEIYLYNPKPTIPAMNFDEFKELLTNNLRTAKYSQVVFDKTGIAEDLGITTAWKSLVEFFSNKEEKKKEEVADEIKIATKPSSDNLEVWMKSMEMKISEIDNVKADKKSGIIFSKSRPAEKVGENKENQNVP